MLERLEFRLTDLESDRQQQVVSAFRPELIRKWWWLPFIPAASLVAWMYVLGRHGSIFSLVVALLAVPVYYLSLRYPNLFRSHSPRERPYRPPWLGFVRRRKKVDVSDDGVLIHGFRAKLLRWRDFEGARLTNEWLELRRGPGLVVLPRRAFGSAANFEQLSKRVASQVSIDPRMEAELPTYLALGDSYTIGEAVPETERFPVQLADGLRSEGTADLASPSIVAMTGWTTDELSSGIRAARLAKRYDLVTLLIGVNNQYRGRSVDEYREQFRDLLERAIGFAGGDRGRVIVSSIPDWGVTPFAEGRDRAQIAREIDAFNEVNGDEANREGVRYVDITPISRRAEGEKRLVAEDGLHPSAAMYRLWVEAILPEAAAALGGG